MDILEEYLTKVENQPKGSKPCLHIVKVEDTDKVLPVQFLNKDIFLQLVEDNWFNFDKTDSLDCRMFLDLDKFVRGSFKKNMDTVFMVIDGFITSTTITKRKGKKPVKSVGFK